MTHAESVSRAGSELSTRDDLAHEFAKVRVQKGREHANDFASRMSVVLGDEPRRSHPGDWLNRVELGRTRRTGFGHTRTFNV
jgi:hypothetical protein